MIVKIENYTLEKGIYSLALREDAFDELNRKNLNVIYLKEKKLIFWPDGLEIDVSAEAAMGFAQCNSYDVFMINKKGIAYLYYNSSSNDNSIVITNKCNSNCIMCPVAETIRRKNCEIEATEILEMIKYFPTDTNHITITGGEPFLIGESIFEIFSQLKRQCRNTKFLLLTNGRALAYKPFMEKFLDTIPFNVVVGIPLHGFDSHTHDFITQSPSGFQQTTSGIKNLLYHGIVVELRLVVCKLNYEYIYQIAELIVKEFPTVKSVKIMGLEMLGNAAQNSELVWISYSEAFQNSKDAIELLVRNNIDVELYNFPLCCVNEEYHLLCKKSISKDKVRYTEICDYCEIKDACGGIFAGSIRFASEEIKYWREDV